MEEEKIVAGYFVLRRCPMDSVVSSRTLQHAQASFGHVYPGTLLHGEDQAPSNHGKACSIDRQRSLNGSKVVQNSQADALTQERTRTGPGPLLATLREKLTGALQVGRSILLISW